ncbi:MAG: ATP-binding protein [Chthoniobacter sp.]|nr:ATP-binding protein [Chthoniobacter sp.]
MAPNPCKCGYFGGPKREWRCSTVDVQRYRNRIHIHVEARRPVSGYLRWSP